MLSRFTVPDQDVLARAQAALVAVAVSAAAVTAAEAAAVLVLGTDSNIPRLEFQLDLPVTYPRVIGFSSGVQGGKWPLLLE